MITVKAQDGKFFFSSFLNLTSGQETQLEETELTLPDLKSLKVAIRTERLETSAEDELKVDATITAKQPGTGGGVDPSVLDAKEDKVNKVQIIGAGSAVSYPSTTAIKTYFNTELTGLNLGQYATTAATDTKLSNKVDKVNGKTLSTNDFTNTYKTQLDGIDATIDGKITTAIENLPPSSGKNVEIESTNIESLYVAKQETSTDIKFILDVIPQLAQNIIFANDYEQPTVSETIPTSSLRENGEYVLTKPDAWSTIPDTAFVMPLYHISTVSSHYAKGIVSGIFSLYENSLIVSYYHTVKTPISNYVVRLNRGERTVTSFDVPFEIESDATGNGVFGDITIPLSTVIDGMTLKEYIQNTWSENRQLDGSFELFSNGLPSAQSIQRNITETHET